MIQEIHKLIEKLPELDWWGRRKTINDLMAYPENEFISFLESGIRDHTNANIRNAAMEVYTALGARAFQSLSGLLADADPEIRLFCVNVLCEIGDRESLPLLFRSINDPDINVRAAAAEALGKTGDPEALGLLQKALGDVQWVALAAVGALGAIGGEEALKILYGCLDKKSIREMAIHVLETTGTQDSIKYLAPCLVSDDLREATVKAIIAIAERERCRPRPEYFISLAYTLKEMYLSSDPDRKKQAFIALCWLEDILSVPYLLDGLKNDELLEYAIEGLLHLGKKAVCNIVDNLKQSVGPHRVVLAKILNMLDENIALLQFAEDDDPEVRTEVALVLGSIPMQRASKTLRKMLEDPHEEVRMAARKSLGLVEKKGLQKTDPPKVRPS